MRVHQHTARRKEHTCSKCSDPIKLGEEYYQYQRKGSAPTRFHTKHGRPRTSELCGGKMSGVYAAVESIEDAVATARSSNDPSGLADTLRDAAQSVEEVKDEYQSSLDNMPEPLQQGTTGQEIQEKIDALESFKDSLESAADELDGETIPDEPAEPGVDHAEDCPENPDWDGITGDACNCGIVEAENEYGEWEDAIEEIITIAENASQELSI